MTDRQTLDALRMDGAFFPYEVRALRTISGAIGHHRADMRVRCGNVIRAVRHQLQGQAFTLLTAALSEIDRLD